MKTIKTKYKIIFIIITLFFLYFFSWLFWGEYYLMDKGLIELIDESEKIGAKYYENNELIIIPKKYNKIIEHDFDVKISDIKIIVISDSALESEAFRNIPDSILSGGIILYGSIINISYYTFPIGQLEYRIFGNDIRTGGRYYLWMFFDWIDITLN